jgi:hypothetical protein
MSDSVDDISENYYYALLYSQISATRFYLSYLSYKLQYDAKNLGAEQTKADWQQIAGDLINLMAPAYYFIKKHQDGPSLPEEFKAQLRKDMTRLVFTHQENRTIFDLAKTDIRKQEWETTFKALDRKCSVWLECLEEDWRNSGWLRGSIKAEDLVQQLLKNDESFREEWSRLLYEKPDNVQQTQTNLKDLIASTNQAAVQLKQLSAATDQNKSSEKNSLLQLEALSHRLCNAALFLLHSHRTGATPALLKESETTLEMADTARKDAGYSARRQKTIGIIDDLISLQSLATSNPPMDFLQNVLDYNHERQAQRGIGD